MLENTLSLLKNKKPLTVAYFGGSITEGAGASSYDNCYAAKTTAWLRAQYPASEITHIQAAIGGTGSTLGMYRCDDDVCRHKPDLVFFEYAVNDSGGNYFELLNNADAILRKLYRSNPFCDVVMIYTMTKSIADASHNGNVQPARTAFSTAAYHYGLLQIDVGEALFSYIRSDDDYMIYTTDTVHPTDAGYVIYAETIRRHMTAAFEKCGDAPQYKAKILPAPLFSPETSHVGAHMVDAPASVFEDAWVTVEESMCGRYPHYIESTTPGAALTFTFTGSRIELYLMLAKDGGDFRYSIDGGEEKTASTWDRYCLSFNRAGNICLAKGLPIGKHTVKITVSDRKNEQSEGHAIRIGAFLVVSH